MIKFKKSEKIAAKDRTVFCRMGKESDPAIDGNEKNCREQWNRSGIDKH